MMKYLLKEEEEEEEKEENYCELNCSLVFLFNGSSFHPFIKINEFSQRSLAFEKFDKEIKAYCFSLQASEAVFPLLSCD